MRDGTARGRSSRWSAVARVMVAALAVVGGCGKKPTQRRTGDAAPVELVTTPALPDGGVPGGPPTDEVEPNDGDDVATRLALGGTVHGKLEPDADVDRYRIDVTTAGALSVVVSSLEGLDAVLELEDASGAVIARSDRGGPRIREGVPNLGVAPGRYTAVVTAKKPPPPRPAPHKRPARKGAEPDKPSDKPDKPIGGPYEITASLIAPAAGAEREPDDDRGQANDLIAGDLATGYLGWTGDLDVWKVSVEALAARNALDVELTAVEGVALSLEIADGIGQPLVTRKGARGAALVIRGFQPAVAQGAPPYLYLTVRGDRSNPETAYQLRALAKLVVPDTEVEPNDTPETATPMPADRKGLRAHWSTGDVDCFAIAPDDAARSLELSIDTPNELDLAIDVVIDGKLTAKVDHPGKGAAEKLLVAVPGGARAVVRVRGADATGEASYELMVTEGAAPP